MQIFFTVLLWVFLALLGILLLLLLMPVCVSVEYDYTKLTVLLRVLGFKFTLYPAKEKAEKAPKPAEETPETPPQSDEKPKQKPTLPTLEQISGLVSTANGAIRLLLKGVFFRKIRIVYPYHQEDPADTAIGYGKLQAYLGGAIATLRNFLHLSFKELSIIPDFANEHKYHRYFYCNIWSSPLIIVIVGIYAAKRIFKEKLIPMKRKPHKKKSV